MKHICTPTTVFLLFIASLIVQAQNKYEFRATWIATVSNIDWPSKPGLSSQQQKQEAIDILNQQQKLGINTIILQIRPSADAFYASRLEPWSHYLCGQQGKQPEPFYDPLRFWINECHRRGMELHAWLNPFRVAQNADTPLSKKHIAFQHPDWIVKYGNKLYFDPGIPEARDYVTGVVKDIVSRYDIDAIHFDDYFYPYPLAEEFPDTTSFKFYNRNFLPETKNDWRRENVDMLIRQLNSSIKAVKPWVKFGISPFGVWRNRSDDPRGSNTQAGATNYDQLYADILKWLKEGWIDYCLPQIYWEIGHPAADFKTLAHWWNEHHYERALYIGHALYKVSAESVAAEWRSPDQLPRQITLVRQLPHLQGSAFFSAKWFNNNLLGFQDSLTQHFYKHPALVPPMPWIDNTPPAAIVRLKKNGRKIKWETQTTANEMDKARFFVVYLNEKENQFDPENNAFIYQITSEKKIELSKINRKKKKYEVRISALDRLNNESTISEPIEVKL